MKQFLSALLTVTLLFCLAACVNGNSNSSSKNQDKSSSVPTNSSDSTISSKPSTSSNTIIIPKKTQKFSEPQFSVSSEDVYSGQLVRYELNSECKGYYFTPKAKGKYPTAILIHGAAGIGNFKDKLLSAMNDWVKQGYIEPMVIIIPEVLNYTGGGTDMQDFQYYISTSYPKRFSALLTSIEKGTLSSQIDTSIPPYVAGFSMGGMAAVHAGAEYNDRVKHVGGLSPSNAFYRGEGDQYGFYKYAKDIYFSKAADAHVYLSAGHGEQDGVFRASINRYERGIKVNNPNIVTKFTAPVAWGGHGWELAQKEIFMYLYFASCGKVPSNALVEAVCNNPNDFKNPTVVTKEEAHT